MDMTRRGLALGERRNAGVQGFTLIELLISIILMIILLSAVTMVFVHTTETVTVSQARTQVYTEARRATDLLEEDLLACLPFNGQQQFSMDNGKGGLTAAGAADPQYPASGADSHTRLAADRLTFVATTMVGSTHQTGRIQYYLLPGQKALDANGNIEEGDPDMGRTMPTPNFPEGRPLYTLIRQVKLLNPQTGMYDQRPVDQLGKPVPDMELCRFVTSFNLEYFSNTLLFSQLDPSPFRSDVTAGGKDDPLGNALGDNDGQGDQNAIPIRIPMIRITITIVEDRAARQERTIQKVIAIPMG